MTSQLIDSPASLPSVDRVLRSAPMEGLIERHGRTLITTTVRTVLNACRRRLTQGGPGFSEVDFDGPDPGRAGQKAGTVAETGL